MGRHAKITLDDMVVLLHAAGGRLPVGCGSGRVPPGMARALALLGEADIVRVRRWRLLPTRTKMVILTPSGAFVARAIRRGGQ